MAQGNKGFFDGIREGTPQRPAAARLPPRTGVLEARENRLAEIALGKAVTRFHELVEPARCRIWEGHNRDYAALSAENCADLIESFKAQGRQEVPAIVRRVLGDTVYGFEVICGARRHWTAAWMREHDFPDFKFLIEPRELTDEEAFRLADLENRSRKDLSDYERAADYARAIERYYEGSQQRMAERLEVTKSWLSRYLELAKLPEGILSAFGSPHVLGIRHAATLAPLLRVPAQQERMQREASAITDEQRARADRSEACLHPAIVLRRLVQAATAKPKSAKPAAGHEVCDPAGSVIASGTRAGRGGGITITLSSPAKHERAALMGAVEEILERLGSAPGQKDR